VSGSAIQRISVQGTPGPRSITVQPPARTDANAIAARCGSSSEPAAHAAISTAKNSVLVS
jgi:hypothetical protein